MLTTDHQGYVSFTGINVAKIGFESLASFIAAQSASSSVPSLGAKGTAKRTRTAEIDFSVSPKPLAAQKTNQNPANKNETFKCKNWMDRDNPFTHLYLKDWLNEYFKRINEDSADHTVPPQLKFQSVDLTSAIYLAADISGGASPYFLGNGTTFIVPINGLTLDWNPDYQHKIDLNLNVCDNTPRIEEKDAHSPNDPNNPCYPRDNKEAKTPLTALMIKQCTIYSYLHPLLSTVTPPKDADADDDAHWVCHSDGTYHKQKDPKAYVPPPAGT